LPCQKYGRANESTPGEWKKSYTDYNALSGDTEPRAQICEAPSVKDFAVTLPTPPIANTDVEMIAPTRLESGGDKKRKSGDMGEVEGVEEEKAERKKKKKDEKKAKKEKKEKKEKN
jgi:H/ACA ribonucleoprotein complex subunit 4